MLSVDLTGEDLDFSTLDSRTMAVLVLLPL
jgi:hypothetical protein